MNKKDLSERDICSKCIGPAVKRAGWDGMMQIRDQVNFTNGRIIVRGKLVTRGKAKRADYILYHKLSIPIAIIEAKDNNPSVGSGMQQALDYAVTLNNKRVSKSPVASGTVERRALPGALRRLWPGRLAQIFRPRLRGWAGPLVLMPGGVYLR